MKTQWMDNKRRPGEGVQMGKASQKERHKNVTHGIKLGKESEEARGWINALDQCIPMTDR